LIGYIYEITESHRCIGLRPQFIFLPLLLLVGAVGAHPASPTNLANPKPVISGKGPECQAAKRFDWTERRVGAINVTHAVMGCVPKKC
jgi:hypothetical protein